MPIIVDMDEIVFLPIAGGSEVGLEAYGVTTCICLALYGRKPDGSSFIGMYHWSGFTAGEAMRESMINENVYGLVCQLITSARQQLGLKENDKLFLDNFFVIGGEQRQEMLTGTEFEVNALSKYIQSHCEDEFVLSDTAGFYFYTYLTAGEEVLTVKMNTISPHPHWLVSGAESDAEDASQMDTGSDQYSICSY